MNLLPALVPVLTFFLLWGIFFRMQDDWRLSFLTAAVSWGCWSVAVTEVLSLFQAISFWPVLGVWCLGLIAACFGWARIVGHPAALLKGFRWPRLEHFEYVLLGSLLAISAVIGLIAWVAPPNTWDSMTYHMARVMHWMQDRSVAFYPTHIIRQLFMNPGSEFLILQFQVLSGTDRLANFVQWFGMVGSAVGVSLIARRMEADRRGQFFAAAVSLTIPMGVLQGSSTQNDYILAFWLVCFVNYLLVLRTEENFPSILPAGASLGLAVLTKATAYIFAFPFLIWLGLDLLKKKSIKGVLPLAVLAVIALLINLGQYLRNYDLFGNPVGLTEDVFSTGGQTRYFKYSNDIFSFPAVLSNVVRNTAANLGTPFAPANRLLLQGVDWVHARLGISPNDPRTTWPETDFQIPGSPYLEDSAGNPQDSLLILFSLVLLMARRPWRKETLGLILSLVAAFLLFSFYLKWQPWNNRLRLPLLVLWSAAVGLALSGVRRKWIANACLLLALLGALPGLLLNYDRPLIGAQNIFNTGRTELYFRNNHSLWYSYPRSVNELGYFQCKRIGLYFDGGSWEYPLWILLQQELGKEVQIESVNVENQSAREYGHFPEFTPCAVLVANPLPVENFRVNQADYSLSLSTKFISVLMQK